jgi:hypothetical protein
MGPCEVLPAPAASVGVVCKRRPAGRSSGVVLAARVLPACAARTPCRHRGFIRATERSIRTTEIRRHGAGNRPCPCAQHALPATGVAHAVDRPLTTGAPIPLSTCRCAQILYGRPPPSPARSACAGRVTTRRRRAATAMLPVSGSTSRPLRLLSSRLAMETSDGAGAAPGPPFLPRAMRHS